MAHLYILTGPLPSDPRYLEITTDDSDVLVSMVLPRYRSADQVIKRLVADWRAHVEGIGSPSITQTITLFKEYISETYGPTYMVRNVW